MLREIGHDVVVVSNGREALARLEERTFPIVLSDWVMPEMDGLQLCRAIRAKFADDYVFIILITARDTSDDVVEGLEAGADDYIKKPFNTDELGARLKSGRRVIELASSLKRANEESTRRSNTDSLTGLYNRGYLDGTLDQEVERAVSLQVPLSVILCDIDCFKQVNDTHGHRAGDSVLEAFAERVRGTVRRSGDWVARFGGEEFLVVLPNTSPEAGAVAAERIRGNVSREAVSIDGQSITVTASFGVAGWVPGLSPDTLDARRLIDLADSLLYQAKKAGRDQVHGGRLVIDSARVA